MKKTPNARADDYTSASIEPNVSAVLGTFEGECADANITNLNGLDITREVWEHVFASDEYERGIKYGWYIGFLGHPEGSADCQDFEHACIVMREGHIDASGKVFGKFDLIDTPVGRIVKAFQDAGVIFGISVRGAGDIIQNSVDPETFTFRGFDLVAFPAYPESIPTFTKVAASSDSAQRQKYQSVCAAVKTNMHALNTVESVDIIQSCFAKQSEEYQALENRKAEILGDAADMALDIEAESVDPRVDAMTQLYLRLKGDYDALNKAHDELKCMYDQLLADSRRKLECVERICSSQMSDLGRTLDKVEGALHMKTSEADSLRRRLGRLDKNYAKIQSSVDATNKHNSKLQRQVDSTTSELEDITAQLEECRAENKRLRSELRQASTLNNQLKSENLKYIEKVKAAQSEIECNNTTIRNLQSELDETVRQQAREKQKSSNRDEQMASMQSRVEAAETLTRDYQDAYANLYANAVGVRLPQLRVTATTDVDSLQRMIRSGASASVGSEVLEPTQDSAASYLDVSDQGDDTLITL